MTTPVEIYFAQNGSTVIGDYSAYRHLDAAIAQKQVFTPHGYHLKCDGAELARLVENVSLFGHCIKTLEAFKKVCQLSGVELSKTPTELL